MNKLPHPNIPITNLLKLPKEFVKHLSPKKQHEIFHLARVVHEQCEKLKISLIVDLGAGLVSH